MSRTYEQWTSQLVRDHMQQLLIAAKSRAERDYRQWMRTIGSDLGGRLRLELPKSGQILVVTTVEDADYLSRGVLEAIKAGERARLFCYWNERDSRRDTAPIISKYEEPLDEPKVSAVVVVKSIVSGACVVRTNLIEALHKLHHEVPVFVVSPVMHIDAKKKLQREFPPSVAKRFEYIICARDRDKDGEIVLPGVGGSVYELLGLGDRHTKNRVYPDIIEERSASFGWQLKNSLQGGSPTTREGP